MAQESYGTGLPAPARKECSGRTCTDHRAPSSKHLDTGGKNFLQAFVLKLTSTAAPAAPMPRPRYTYSL